jgi:hypothetical protein
MLWWPAGVSVLSGTVGFPGLDFLFFWKYFLDQATVIVGVMLSHGVRFD